MKILVDLPMDETEKQALAALVPQAEITYVPAKEATADQIAGAEIMLGNYPISLLAEAKQLKWIQLSMAGSDSYAAPGVLPEGVILTNASGAYGLAISEHMLAGALKLIKKLGAYQRNQDEHLWHSEGGVTSIYGSTTLVVGLGDLGGSFARRMHALDSTVIGIRRTASEKPDYVSALYQMDALDRLLPMADFVALTLPNSKLTQKVMGAKQFAAMKDTAILINVGRGTSVDTDALVTALSEGQIGGAVLDVTDPEPLPADHPLWDAPNLVLTPHVSGGSSLRETGHRIAAIAMRNLAAYLNGQPMENVVDFKTGYRRSGDA